MAAIDTDSTYANTVASLTHFWLVFAAILAFLSPVYVAGLPLSILGMKSLSFIAPLAFPLCSTAPSVLKHLGNAVCVVIMYKYQRVRLAIRVPFITSVPSRIISLQTVCIASPPIAPHFSFFFHDQTQLLLLKSRKIQANSLLSPCLNKLS